MINNLPTYTKDYEFIVVTDCDGELWFYGAYTDEAKAQQVACEIRGQVVRSH